MNKLKCIFGGHRYRPSEINVTWLHDVRYLATAKCINCGQIRQFEFDVPLIPWYREDESAQKEVRSIGTGEEDEQDGEDT